ncbi:MAG: thioredoxin [Candidatus Nealsonbacteria bacterium]|nr:thioredoxin [Candidatus Nealsonbacteria bacterium]
MIEVTKDNFETEVLKETGKPVMVDFWGPKCSHCLILMPHVEKLAHQYSAKIKVVKMNMTGNVLFCAKAGLRIMGLPTFIFFENGKEVKRLTGQVTVEELEKTMEEIL